MNYNTIFLFFVIAFGLGYTLTKILKKNSDNFLERQIMRVAFGMAFFIVIAVFLNLLHIPLYWWVIFLAALIVPAYDFYSALKNKQLVFPKIKLTKSNLYIFVALLIFFLSLFMYVKGSFSYPWLEDGDPWIHANGVKYVAEEKTLYEKDQGQDVLQYIDPYPPGYEAIFGMLYQFNPSNMIWHMKFFNALIISLGVLFFYFFAKKFTKDSKKALFAMFILAATPCYLSHFIWAHSLVIMFIFPVLYALESMKKDRRWIFIASVLIGAMLMTQPSQSMKFAIILFVYLLVNSIVEKKIWLNGFLAGIYGLLISFLWWIPTFIKRGVIGSIKSGDRGFGKAVEGAASRWYEFKVAGSADRAYSFSDFFIAKAQNMINNPIGVGTVLVIVLMLALVLMMVKQVYTLIKAKDKAKVWMFFIIVVINLVSLVLLMFSFLSPLNIMFESNMDLGLQAVLAVFSLTLISAGYIFLIFNKFLGKKEVWVPIALLFLAFTLFGIHGASLPLQFWAFRFWMQLAIPISLVSAEGVFILFGFIKKQDFIKFLIIFIIVLGVLVTSAKPKYELNTSQWGTTGSLMQYNQLGSWLWVNDNIPDNSKVYYSCTSRFGDFALVSFDKWACNWCDELRESKKTMLNKSVSSIHGFLKSKDYEYLIVDANCVKDFGENVTNQKIQEIAKSIQFEVIHQGSGMIVWKVL